MRKKDMYLPNWVCGLGVLFLAGGIVFAVLGAAGAGNSRIGFLVVAVICLGLGAAAILCWKNQGAEMLNDCEFVYSTMFGRKISYRFSDIRDIKQNSDSMTLLLKNGKVHIESCAVISDRFADRINSMLGPQ